MIPIHGSMTRPEKPEEGLQELEKGLLQWKGNKGIEIEYETDEFTAEKVRVIVNQKAGGGLRLKAVIEL